jgi:hypothetical protein
VRCNDGCGCHADPNGKAYCKCHRDVAPMEPGTTVAESCAAVRCVYVVRAHFHACIFNVYANSVVRCIHIFTFTAPLA